MTSESPQNAKWLDGVSPEELRRIVDVLYRVHRFVALITDLDTLLARIMEESKQVACAEACSLMLYDASTDELYFEVALGESGDQEALKREIRLRLGEGIAGVAAESRQSINVQDVRKDPRFYPSADEASHFETRSLLAVPLVDKDNLIGVVEVVNKVGEGCFTDADLHVMEIFAGLVATSIANARLIEENLRAERLAALGQAVAGLAHYTKNIITGMSGSVDLIDQGLSRNNTEFLERSWPIFKRSTKRIANFVEDMLAFSKPRVPHREPCDIALLIEDVSQTFWAMLSRKKVELFSDTSGLTAQAQVDPRGIYRCLLNLVLNAAEAMPKEGGKIWVTAKTLECKTLVIEVADNGPGVPERDVKRIFDPFYSTKGSQGTGLGLAVCAKIIGEHGGQIVAGRASEGGALFRIVVPDIQ
ncbi:MAG: GAF domain-containing protein [Candidatus Hydrogenedentes bacterium]|nr:GAF domain-containing protein [Candidatus Hydrogenedentota bacterium]